MQRFTFNAPHHQRRVRWCSEDGQLHIKVYEVNEKGHLSVFYIVLYQQKSTLHVSFAASQVEEADQSDEDDDDEDEEDEDEDEEISPIKPAKKKQKQ